MDELRCTISVSAQLFEKPAQAKFLKLVKLIQFFYLHTTVQQTQDCTR